MKYAIKSYKDLKFTKSQLVDQLKFFGDLLSRPLSQRMDLDEYSKKLLKFAEIWFVVVDPHYIVGMMVFYANNMKNHEAHMPMISVHPNYKHKGLAKTMIHRVIAIARQKGMKSLSLGVQRDNHVAHDFYKSLGFRFTRTESNSWNMRLSLSEAKSYSSSIVTPVHEAPALSATFDMDIDLRIKRDDLYLMPGGGSKARKIECIVKHALENGYNALVSNGGPQSNHARATAISSAYHDLPCHLVIVLRPGEKYINTGNILLMKLAGASIEYCEKNQLASRMDSAVNQLANRGYKPLYIWGGGHCVQGTIPFVNAVEEFSQQTKDWEPDFIVSASATGSTQAGFAIGFSETNTRVIGISAARDKERGSRIVSQCVEEYFEYMDLPWEKIEIDFRDDWTEGGYEKHSDRLFKVIEMAAKTGFFFDPTYTGKAFNGLVELVKRGEIPKGSKVLFWHTGGLMNLMAARKYMEMEIMI